MSILRIVPIILFVQVLFSPHVLSQSSLSKEYVVKEIQKKYSAVENISADFVQKTRFKFSSQEQIQSGSVIIGKDNKFKIIVPQQLIVSDGKTVWVYSEPANQVLINTFKQMNTIPSPERLLQGLSKDFEVSTMTVDSGTVSLSLVPVHGMLHGATITEMTLTATQNDWTVHRVNFTETNGTSVSVEFSHIRFNNTFSSKEFELTPDPSTHIIDLRKKQ